MQFNAKRLCAKVCAWSVLTISALIGGCAAETMPVEGDEVVGAEQPLVGQSISKEWYTDSSFNNLVGGLEIYCSGGKQQWGTTARFVMQWTEDCQTGNGTLTCMDCVPAIGGGLDCTYISCP